MEEDVLKKKSLCAQIIVVFHKMTKWILLFDFFLYIDQKQFIETFLIALRLFFLKCKKIDHVFICIFIALCPLCIYANESNAF